MRSARTSQHLHHRPLRGAGKAMPEDARRHNRSLALQALFGLDPLSRADLARSTHLTPTTASDLVSGLLDDGLVEEVGRRPGRGAGKPATLLSIVPDGRHLVCLDLSDEEAVVGAVINLAGTVVTRRTLKRNGRVGDDAVDLVAELAESLAADTDRPLLGVGIGSPGLVDGNGVVVAAWSYQWARVPLAEILSARLDLPVHVVNDANAATLGEFTFGHTTAQNFVVVKLGQGVGAGLVIDGRLVSGERAAAGEIGHVVVDERGDLCACGNRGCVELAVAVPFVRQRLAAAGADAAAHRRVVAGAGRRLGIALATVVSAIDSQEVVLSGPPDIVDDRFCAAVLATIRRRTIALIGEHVDVRVSSLGIDDVLFGAASLVLSQELGIA